MSEFVGFGVQVELKDGKLIQGKIAKATSKGLTLNEVRFGDGGTSQAFKVRASRLKNLNVLTVAPSKKDYREQKQQQQQQQQQSPSDNIDWQNDDVMKLKQQDDFDFQGNLRMFNKKDVFAELKQRDEVAPQDRLVSHNKRPTQRDNDNVVDNIQNDEMVIPNAKNDAWNQISSAEEEDDDDEEDEDDDEYYDVSDSSYMPVTKSINITHLLHSASSDNKEKDKRQDHMIAQLEQLIINQSRATSLSNASSSIATVSSPTTKPLVLKAKDTTQTVPMANPVQLLEIERVNADQFGISSHIMLENFATNSSFFLKQKLGGRARLRLNNNNPEPLVVILTSDSNRSGARAMALGRHLCQSGHIRVIALFTCSSTDLQDLQVKEQFELFKKCGGKIANSVAALENAVEKLNSPVEIVIDAMQGFDCNLVDLYENTSTSDDYDTSSATERRTLDMISWCNRTCESGQRQIWSLDIPSGFDSGSGQRNFDLAVEATGVICTGWPLVSLHTLKQNSSHHLHEAVVIDMGTPQCVYSQRTSLRKFQSCDLFITEGSLALEL